MTASALLEYLQRLGIELWVEDDRLRYSSPKGVLTPDLHAELVANKVEIITRLRQTNNKSVPQTWQSLLPPSLSRQDDRPRDGDWPLSFAQQRLWFLDQLEPGNPFYTIATSVNLSGPLHTDVLLRSLNEIVRRHDILRTRFTVMSGEPLQHIALAMELPVPVVDLSSLAPAQQEVEIDSLNGAETARPFDLSWGPLIRAILLTLSATEHVLLLNLHHIVCDGWSLSLLLRELSALYAAFASGKPSPLPELTLQYTDFARWQREWLQDALLDRRLDFWKEHLADAPALLELPTDHPRPEVQTFRGAHSPFAFPASLSLALHTLSSSEDATLFMTLLAAFATLLGRLSGQNDIVIGTPIAGRMHRNLEELIGCFVNTLALRSDLSDNPRFRTLLRRVSSLCMQAYAQQEVPFEKVVEAMAPSRDLGHAPLFQVLFVMQNVPLAPRALSDVTIQAREVIDNGTARVDLSLVMVETPQGLRGHWEYNTDLFEEATMRRLSGYLQHLLEGIVSNPDQRLSDLPLLDNDERIRLLQDWCGTQPAFPELPCLHEFFEAQVERTPDAIAVVSGDEHLTYDELNRWSNRLARCLRRWGVEPEVLVGLFLERSLDLVVGLLAIYKAGGACVPLDSAAPKERLTFMINDTCTALVLTQLALAPRLTLLDTPIICLDSVWEQISHEEDTSPGNRVWPENLACVIYTSGSTGKPKGIAIPHIALSNRLQWGVEDLQLTACDHLLQIAALSFDVALWELFGPWLVGARLVLAPPDIYQQSSSLVALLIEQQITVVHLVTSVLLRVLEEPALGHCSHLRSLLYGGEASPPDLLRRFFAHMKTVQLHHYYGPTEAAINATSWVFNHEQQTESITIGRPIRGMQVYLLDSYMQPVPPGSVGELYIGGIGVTRGYLYRPGLTAEYFIPHPFNRQHGERLYRTGDRARYQADGTLVFVGRNDAQVKIRGHRIELGEIEAVLREHPQVRDVVVLLREDHPGDQRLVAYVVPQEQPQPPGLSALRSWLETKLPDYMLPSALVLLDRLPLSAHHKVDRGALPAPGTSRPELEALYSSPRTPIEEILTGIWSQVLRIEQVGTDDDFFALGGHSLLATQVIARIRDVLQVEIPVRALFEAPTITQITRRISQEAAKETFPPIGVRRSDEDALLSFAQQRLWFLDQLEGGSSTYNMPAAIRLSGTLNRKALQESLNEIVRRHETLRTTFSVVAEKPIQVIAPVLTISLPVINLCSLPTGRQEIEVQHLACEEGMLPFDLARGPLLRTSLLWLDDTEHVLLLNMHHIISDGWSLGVLVHELSVLYAAFVNGQPSPLVALPVQYADFALWQRTWLQGAILEQQLAYWREQLRGAPTVLELPTDHPRPPVQTYQGARHGFQISPELSQAVVVLSQRAGVTLFMTLFAAFATLMLRYSGQEDIVIGTPIANRRHTELEGLIGFFANTLVLRTDLSGDPDFLQLLARIRTLCLQAYAHQDLPFEKLVEELVPERSLSHSPLFQVLFVLQNASDAMLSLSGLKLQQFDIDNGTSKFDLTLFIQESEQGFRSVLEYNNTLFDESTIQRMASHLQHLLAGVIADPTRPLSSLPILEAIEREQLLVAWNATQMAYPDRACVHHLFEAQVERSPDTVAIVYSDEHVTYRELNQRANCLASRLQALSVGPDVLVGLCLERSLAVAVGLLAIFKAGGAYVPLDPGYPQERLAFMLEDTRTPVILTQQHLAGRLPTHHARIIFLDATEHDATRQYVENPRSAVQPENLAYVIYTSGSTGKPKGVSLSHRALVNLLAWHYSTLIGGARTLQFASLSFDASFHEMFAAWGSGGTILMLSETLRRDIVGLAHFLVEMAIEKMILPVVVLQQLAEEYLAHQYICSHFQEITTTGEQMHITMPVRAWFKRMEHCALHNHYGPSESHVVTSFTLARPVENWPTHPSIGQPIANTQMYILDAHLQPEPIGVVGELYIGGVSLARGYLGWPELTAERFIPDPLSTMPGGRLYKTGDVARYLPDGNIEYLGRRDHQVKLRGYRVELEEIEAALGRHPRVRETVVLAREDMPGDKRLVAYVVPDQEPSTTEQAVTGSELRRYLQAQLPDYMIPSAFVILAALPLTTNGKVDRHALPAPAQLRPALEEAFVAPRTHAEILLAAIWADILRIEQVGINDNFFNLGGHSLLATQVVARVRDTFQVEIPLRSLFEKPTIDGLIEELARLWGGRETVEEIARTHEELAQLSEEEIQVVSSE
ncbi:MAG TPA: amino acid adenylation domain-containing protein [Ktedonobacteraceae bacterium]|nr:amino acid adenylation domain-containing protein [Ktedonobacteraceae bacterium]